MIDPKELPVYAEDTEWLTDLISQHERLLELEDMFASKGWAHLSKMLEVKEDALIAALLQAKDFEDVKAKREVIMLTRWLRAMPQQSAVLAKLRAEEIDESMIEREDEQLGTSD